ncbi:MAG TPA: hypothetical protein VI462_03410, partial [Acidimicrobiia bacterium]
MATALVGVVALGLGSGPAGAATTTLFNSDASSLTPGFYASAATVPAGICSVAVTADGGHGGAGDFGGAGGAAARVTATVHVTPGEVL